MEQDLFRPYTDGLKGHFELRAQTNKNRNVVVSSGNVVVNMRSENSGVFARAWEEGVFGACAAPGFGKKEIEAVIQGAKENTALLSGRGSFRPLPQAAKGNVGAKADFRDQEQAVYIDYLRELEALITGKYKNISNCLVRVFIENTETVLAVTEGTNVHRILPRAIVSVRLSAFDTGGLPVNLKKTWGGGGNFDDYFSDPKLLAPDIDVLYGQLMDKREGVYTEAGTTDVVLGANLAGVLAHEAIGHTTESDLLRSGSIAAFNKGRTVASEKVTLVDYAHTAFGKEAPLPVYVDDEGVPGEDVVIIKDGVLQDYMTNLQDAPYIDTVPKGNGRAFCYSDEPLVRMRNTCILPGNDNLAEMIASIEKGYYLLDYSNGQADSTSEFMFGVNMGYEIKNGKLGKAVKDTTISGVAFDILKTVDMVGGDVVWSAAGYCGKKQRLGTAMGGPDIKCRINIGGR